MVTILRWVAVTVTALVLYGVLVHLLQRSVLFPGRRVGVAGTGPEAVGGEVAWLSRPEGEVEVWFLPAHRSAGPGPTLVFAHGNGELIDDWLHEFEAPRSWGLSILLVEYPGYGRSGGRPSERSITGAMIAAHDWVRTRPEADPERIVAFGRSVGGGAAAALAMTRPVAALVLESAFTSVRAMARRQAVPGFLIRDPFDNLGAVRRYQGPVLIVHGARDAIVPPSHARALHAAATDAELHLLDCGHNDCPRPWPLLRRFLEAHGLL